MNHNLLYRTALLGILPLKVTTAKCVSNTTVSCITFIQIIITYLVLEKLYSGNFSQNTEFSFLKNNYLNGMTRVKGAHPLVATAGQVEGSTLVFLYIL